MQSFSYCNLNQQCPFHRFGVFGVVTRCLCDSASNLSLTASGAFKKSLTRMRRSSDVGRICENRLLSGTGNFGCHVLEDAERLVERVRVGSLVFDFADLFQLSDGVINVGSSLIQDRDHFGVSRKWVVKRFLFESIAVLIHDLVFSVHTRLLPLFTHTTLLLHWPRHHLAANPFQPSHFSPTH
jgi:hypothetical protein